MTRREAERRGGWRPSEPPDCPPPEGMKKKAQKCNVPRGGKRKRGLKEGARPTEPPRKPRPSRSGENPIPPPYQPAPEVGYPLEGKADLAGDVRFEVGPLKARESVTVTTGIDDNGKPFATLDAIAVCGGAGKGVPMTIVAAGKAQAANAADEDIPDLDSIEPPESEPLEKAVRPPARCYPIEDGLRSEQSPPVADSRLMVEVERVSEERPTIDPKQVAGPSTVTEPDPAATTEPRWIEDGIVIQPPPEADVENAWPLPDPDPELRSYRPPTKCFAEGFFIGALIGGALCGVLLKAFGHL